jgi:hypothetical protein
MGVAMSDDSERREARRYTMNLPLRVLPLDDKGGELDGHTRDVSYRGLYFVADAKFDAGSEIEFVITLPEEITRLGDVKIRCHGKVVRVEHCTDGRLGIAAKIARYEFMPVAASAA